MPKDPDINFLPKMRQKPRHKRRAPRAQAAVFRLECSPRPAADAGKSRLGTVADIQEDLGCGGGFDIACWRVKQ